MATVTFDGTRVNDSDSVTDWSNYLGGGPAPASEPQLRYQYSGTGSVGAVNRKVTSTAARQGVEYDPGAGAVDMTAANRRLWFAKVYIADYGDLNATWGVELRFGSASTQVHTYNVAGTGANRSVFNNYPAKGGYLIVAIDPSTAAWREASGSVTLTAVDYWAVGAQFVSGGAKSENVAMDAIDIGRGLLLTGTTGTFIDFLTTDQGTIANRWGVVDGSAPIVNCRGLLTIGSATATTFSDSTSIVLFVDGYHGPGHVGTLFDLQNASSTGIVMGAQLIGLGSSTTSDTRPDFTVSGTSGDMTISGVLQNHRNVVLTSAALVDGADIEADDLAVGGAEIKNATIRPTSAANVAMTDDATFGTSSGIHDTTFVQGGSGHAIELTTGSAFTFTNIDFSGFGGTAGSNPTANSGATDAAVFNDTGGAVTITVSGGTNLSVRNGAGATTTVVTNVVNYSVTAATVDGTPVQSANVFLEAANGTGSLPYQESVTIVNSGTTATVTHTGHGLATGDKVVIRGASLNVNNGVYTISVSDTNTYTYTLPSAPGSSPTGTITSTWVALFGTTDVNGEISGSRAIATAQPVVGRVRKSSSAPYYKNSPLNSTIPTSGTLPLTAVMLSDD